MTTLSLCKVETQCFEHGTGSSKISGGKTKSRQDSILSSVRRNFRNVDKSARIREKNYVAYIIVSSLGENDDSSLFSLSWFDSTFWRCRCSTSWTWLRLYNSLSGLHPARQEEKISRLHSEGHNVPSKFSVRNGAGARISPWNKVNMVNHSMRRCRVIGNVCTPAPTAS